MMDKISFGISKVKFENTSVDVVDIYINDRNLVDILREIELPFAEKEGHPNIAGGYMGLSPKDVFLPSKNLLHEGGATVLVCKGCGEEGCWPFCVRTKV